MSRRAWLTPDDLPVSTNCFKIRVPNSLEFEAVFRGALLLLAEAYNWEQVGSTTPQECADLWASTLLDDLLMVPCEVSMVLPVGSFQWWAGTEDTIPDNWLLCDGSSLDTTAYAELFAAIGYTYGGSGSSFNIPDLYSQGVVAARTGGFALGDSGGNGSVTLSVSNLPAHSHDVLVNAASGANAASLAGTKTQGATQATSQTGSGVAFSVLNPYIAMFACIVAG